LRAVDIVKQHGDAEKPHAGLRCHRDLASLAGTHHDFLRARAFIAEHRILA